MGRCFHSGVLVSIVCRCGTTTDLFPGFVERPPGEGGFDDVCFGSHQAGGPQQRLGAGPTQGIREVILARARNHHGIPPFIVAAGLIINVVEGVMNGVVLMSQWAEQMTSLNRSPAGSVKQIIVLNLWGFAAGIMLVWLYAAIRPRFGAGPRTAIYAGLFTWLTICGMGNAVPVILHVYRLDLGLIGVSFEAVEMVLAALAGCALYREISVESMKTSSAGA